MTEHDPHEQESEPKSSFTLRLDTNPSWFYLRLDTSVEPEPPPEEEGSGGGRPIAALPLTLGGFEQRVAATVSLERRFEQTFAGEVSLRAPFEQRAPAAATLHKAFGQRVPAVRLASNRYAQALADDEMILLLA